MGFFFFFSVYTTVKCVVNKIFEGFFFFFKFFFVCFVVVVFVLCLYNKGDTGFHTMMKLQTTRL